MSYKLQVTNYKFAFVLFAFFALSPFRPFVLFAQSDSTPMEEPVKTEMEIVKDRVEENAGEIKKLKKFKVSGYVQAQFEVGQEFASTKVGNPTGFDNTRDGKYDKETKTSGTDNFFRFGIRRGRIKFAWEETWGTAVFQLDLTEKGVGFKDAYFKVSEPWLKVFSLTVGIFDRPFGDEIGYSSSRRESPERTILFQKLFPDERDLGAMVTIAGPKASAVDGLKLDAGAFCGNGITLPDIGKMDFIGHLKYDKKWSDFTFGVGASMYYGTVRNRDTMLYTIQKNDEGIFSWKSEDVNALQKNVRAYYGFDAQFSAQSSWGISNIRAEVLWGQQPSQSGDLTSPKWNLWQTGSSALQYAQDYNRIRNFWGAHVYFVQDIYKTPLTVVLKYAYMNPNTKIDKEAITNKTDLPYNYFGAGLLVRCTSYMRLMCFYESPFNTKVGEKDPLAPKEGATPSAGKNHVQDWTNHVKEGVFTCRLQFKF
jgi:hypothetical protein